MPVIEAEPQKEETLESAMADINFLKTMLGPMMDQASYEQAVIDIKKKFANEGADNGSQGQ